MIDKLIEKGVEKGFSHLEKKGDLMMTKEAKSAITSAATWSAIVSLIPLWGLETIIIIFILWNMYVNICSAMKVPFSFASILGGFATNIIVCLVFNVMFDWLFGLGWIIAAIAVWGVTYYSGKAYLGTLTTIYQQSSQHKDRINSQLEKAQVKQWTGLTWYNDGITDSISRKGDFGHDLKYCLANCDYVLEHLDAFEKHFKFFLQPQFLNQCADADEMKCAYNFLMALLNMEYLESNYFCNDEGDIDWARINKGMEYAQLSVNAKNNPEEARCLLLMYSVWLKSNTDEELYRKYNAFPSCIDESRSYISYAAKKDMWIMSFAFSVMNKIQTLFDTDKVKCAQSARFWTGKFDFSTNYESSNFLHIMWINALESLGYFCQHGEGGIEINYPEALRIWNLSIKWADSDKAKANLAEMYDEGWGVAMDKDKARAMYQDLMSKAQKGSELYQFAFGKLNPDKVLEQMEQPVISQATEQNVQPTISHAPEETPVESEGVLSNEEAKPVISTVAPQSSFRNELEKQDDNIIIIGAIVFALIFIALCFYSLSSSNSSSDSMSYPPSTPVDEVYDNSGSYTESSSTTDFSTQENQEEITPIETVDDYEFENNESYESSESDDESPFDISEDDLHSSFETE